MESRKIYNPIQKDYMPFLKTAAETNGKYTLVEVNLADEVVLDLIFTRHTVKNLIAFWEI